MCTYFKTETDIAQNLIDDFFPFLTVRGPFHRKNFKWKNYGGTGLISEKMEVYMQNLTKERKQPPVVILQQAIFYNIFTMCLWLRIIRKCDQSV